MADEHDIELSGLGLIEASAGTGKTYKIQDLFFKLIAGCKKCPDGFPIESILVVTFTEAATMELKERIRQILVDGLMFFENPELLKRGPETDGTPAEKESEEYRRIKELLAEVKAAGAAVHQEIPEESIKNRIRKALISFDDAMIFTIHGFCQRMLQRYAFDCGILFNIEFRNEDTTIAELEDDYLRQKLYPELSPLYQALFAAAGGKSSIIKDSLCRKLISRPDILVTETGSTNIDEILGELESLLTKLRGPDSADQLPAGYVCSDELKNWLRSTGSIVDSTGESVLKILIDLANNYPPSETESDYLKTIRDFASCLERFVRILPYHAAVQIKERFEKVKQDENFQTFDDLLQRMNRVLTGPRGKTILEAVRKQFKAAFVDEFQDTDPVQYEIFRTLFGDPKTGHILFFVGDPKQAIYSFRGGDIATYRRARQYILEKKGMLYSLDQNFRSASRLVCSVNRLFSEWQPPAGHKMETVFADPAIPFTPVTPGKMISTLTSADGQTDSRPLKFCWAEPPSDKKDSDFKEYVRELCVTHIEKLLGSGWMIPGDKDAKKPPRRLRPGDIAVLVPQNEDAVKFRQALNKRNIPCIVTKAENVFDTPAAQYLKTVLSAILSYSDKRLILETMTTPLLGYSPEQIRKFCLDANDRECMQIQEDLMSLNQLWEQDGFLKCFQEMLTTFKIREKLLKSPLGSRILTDLMQLQELLIQAEMENGFKKEGLLIFLAGQIDRQEKGDPPEQQATRMETDQSAVVLMTLHKSKGLEFPVVMLPFMFSKTWKKNKSGPVFYHDDNGDFRLSLEPDNKIIEQKSLEDKQENIRLLYVGLTRAKYACFLYWGDPDRKAGEEKENKKSRKSKSPKPEAPKDTEPSNSLEWLFADIRCNGFSPGQTYPQLRGCEGCQTCKECQGCDGCEILTDGNITVPRKKPAEKENQDSPGLILPQWQRRSLDRFLFTSFSSLVKKEIKTVSEDDPPQDSDGLDYDDSDDDDGNNLNLQTPEGIFKMPSGSAVGNAWHKILEKLDFIGFDSASCRDLAEQELESFGILRRDLPSETRKEYIDLTLKMIGNVLHTPLGQHTGPAFSLNQIPMSDRLIELRFNYSFLHSVDMAPVRTLLAQYVRKTFGTDSSGIRDLVLDGGFLNGAIDLLFRRNGKLYIADWKSNRISGSVSGFDQAGLAGEIARHTYYFQYLIYTVAAMKYLSLHLSREITEDDYDENFGGVYYFFLRGIDRNIPGQGVFFNRPDFELIHNLDKLIG